MSWRCARASASTDQDETIEQEENILELSKQISASQDHVQSIIAVSGQFG